MKKYKIFVSGAQKELKAERRAVKDSIAGDVLLSEYFNVFLFEDLSAKSRSASAAYLEEARKNDGHISDIMGIYQTWDMVGDFGDYCTIKKMDKRKGLCF